MKNRVLVVDDDLSLRTLLQEVLQDEEIYEVEIAVDGLEALDKLGHQFPRYDVMLLDLTMPRMNGLQVLQALCQQARTCPLPVIVLSSDMDAIHQAVRMGICHFLRKPFDLDQLLTLITSILSGENRWTLSEEFVPYSG